VSLKDIFEFIWNFNLLYFLYWILFSALIGYLIYLLAKIFGWIKNSPKIISNEVRDLKELYKDTPKTDRNQIIGIVILLLVVILAKLFWL
jgi:hypothetical protein